MSLKTVLITSLLSAVLFAGGLGVYRHYADASTGFDLKPATVASDLNGHTVGMPFGQAWPFDNGQNIDVVKVFGKKSGVTPDTVVVYAFVRSAANVVPQDKKDAKDAKDAKKDGKEIKSVRVKVEGVIKLTYEKAGNEWFLVQADNMTLRATMEEPVTQ